MSKENAQMHFRLALALATALLIAVLAPAASASYEDFAIEESSAALSGNQAGAHADFQTQWKFAFDAGEEEGQPRPWGALRDVLTELPPGLLGNPAAFPTCKAEIFAPSFTAMQFCHTDTQVGMIEPGVLGFFPAGTYKTPLINLEPPTGDPNVVARLGFVAVFFPMYVDIRLDPKRDYALTAALVNVPSVAPVTGSINNFWAVPTDSSHDAERFTWWDAIACGGLCGEPVPSGLDPTPFMTNPRSCGPAEVGTGARSYEFPDGFDWAFDPLATIEGCESVPFDPTMSLAPTTNSAGASSGIDVNLQIPQEGLIDPAGRGPADLKTAVVRLPEGVALNPSAVDGLGSCTEEQIGVDRIERQITAVGGKGAPVALSFGGQSTAYLPQLATPAQVQAALEALPNVAPGDVAVSGRRGGPWTVDFTGAMAGQDVQPIGGVHSELQQLTVAAAAGTYTLTFDGETTASLPYTAEAAAVQAALEALPGVDPGEMEVTGGPTMGQTGGGWEHRSFHLVFTGPLAGTDASLIATTNELTGKNAFTPPVLQVATLTEGGTAIVTQTVKQGGTLGFDSQAPNCPESSKVATGEIITPVLATPLKASVYMASQGDNPFNSLFAGYLVARGQGVLLKVPAKFDVDATTGQVVATFGNNPQQPFSSLDLRFKGGNRGLITTPSQCGTYRTSYSLTPWSGTPPVQGTSEFTINQNCGPKPFAPGFRAGSSSPLAGSFTTFATQVTRDAGSPVLTGIGVDLPPGVTAKLAGVPYCPEAALASVPVAAGSGAGQLATPSCPAASQVGRVVAGTGSGAPFYVDTGKAYLAGPYKGAPLSLAVVVPALAGPFDLGNVTVRVAVSLDRPTAQVHAVSDPLPTILQGVPLDIRDVRVLLDRSDFMLNPTNCEPLQATGTITGAGGVGAQVSSRFQVGECAALGFKPRIALRLKGGTKRSDNPALTVTLRPRPGDANLSGVSVAFPRSEFLDQSHIRTVCTRVQFAADQCPAGSVYGSVTAWTPLLDEPLRGNVILRSSNNKLPDLVTDLRGPAAQPIKLEAAGRIDSVNGGMRSTFELMPDAPITRVVLEMQGGRKGLLENSRNICAKAYRATVGFTAHNGRTHSLRPKLLVRCKG
ncbi:MAG TPA: hypothetical protein VFZ19_02135, partial [Solirubrobacterales bacterium]